MANFKQRLRKEERGKIIVRATSWGIAGNLLIASVKLLVGYFSASIAVRSDAINNITDVFSSVATLVGYKLAKRDPSRQYPMGYGRIEYITGTLVGAIILYAGCDFLVASIGRILHPTPVHFTLVQISLLFLTIVGKIIMAYYNIRSGERAQSDALVAAGRDALSDVVYSLVIALSALTMLLTDWQIDGYLGVAVSVMIIWMGIKTIGDVLQKIIGARPDAELSLYIIEKVKEYPPIQGGHDLLLHDYGPLNKIGNMVLEFPPDVSLEKAYNAMQDAREAIYQELGIDFSFSFSCITEHNLEAYEVVERIMKDLPGSVSVHCLHFEKEKKFLRFDAVVETCVVDRQRYKQAFLWRLHKIYPDFHIDITVEYDTIG